MQSSPSNIIGKSNKLWLLGAQPCAPTIPVQAWVYIARDEARLRFCLTYHLLEFTAGSQGFDWGRLAGETGGREAAGGPAVKLVRW